MPRRKEQESEPSTPKGFWGWIRGWIMHEKPNHEIPPKKVPDDARIWFAAFDNEPCDDLTKPESQRFQS